MEHGPSIRIAVGSSKALLLFSRSTSDLTDNYGIGLLLELNSLLLLVMYGIGGILPVLALCLGNKVSSNLSCCALALHDIIIIP